MSKSTVSRLRASIPGGVPETSRNAEKREDRGVGDGFPRRGAGSLIRIDRITLDQDWLLSQDAASLATFYGVKADKAIRILEASERANRVNGADSFE